MCKIVYHPKYSLYNLGSEHPFSPQRVQMLIELLQTWNVYKEPLQPEPIDPDALKDIHSDDYIDTVEKVSKGIKTNDAEKYSLGTADNPIVEGMAEGARYQVGGTLLGAQLLLENKADKVITLGGGFHHAHKNMAAGFCVYNDLAVAIKEMTDNGWHVAYLDIDVHHGDGVQELFYNNDKVMTISIHESGEFLFPGSGWIHELGQGSGRSLKLNVPLEPFSEGDSYLMAIDRVVKPALSWFRPNALIVQAGADAHFSDPLADNLLTTLDYEIIFNEIINISDSLCNGKTLFTFGGGYSPTATPRVWALLYLLVNKMEVPEYLPEAWKNKWEKIINQLLPKTLHDSLPAFDLIPRKEEILNTNKDTIRRLMDSVALNWF